MSTLRNIVAALTLAPAALGCSSQGAENLNKPINTVEARETDDHTTAAPLRRSYQKLTTPTLSGATEAEMPIDRAKGPADIFADLIKKQLREQEPQQRLHAPPTPEDWSETQRPSPENTIPRFDMEELRRAEEALMRKGDVRRA